MSPPGKRSPRAPRSVPFGTERRRKREEYPWHERKRVRGEKEEGDVEDNTRLVFLPYRYFTGEKQRKKRRVSLTAIAAAAAAARHVDVLSSEALPS